jgi:hypothetical protein
MRIFRPLALKHELLIGIVGGIAVGVLLSELFRPERWLIKNRMLVLTSSECQHGIDLARQIEADPRLSDVVLVLPLDDAHTQFSRHLCAATVDELRSSAAWFHLASNSWICDRVVSLARTYAPVVLPTWVVGGEKISPGEVEKALEKRGLKFNSAPIPEPPPTRAQHKPGSQTRAIWRAQDIGF